MSNEILRTVGFFFFLILKNASCLCSLDRFIINLSFSASVLKLILKSVDVLPAASVALKELFNKYVFIPDGLQIILEKQ